MNFACAVHVVLRNFQNFLKLLKTTVRKIEMFHIIRITLSSTYHFVSIRRTDHYLFVLLRNSILMFGTMAEYTEM